MPPKLLVDIEHLDLNTVVDDIEGVRKYNQQRFEMEMLTGILHFDLAAGLVVAYLDTTPNDFWVRGHVPGRPLMPGVMMCECAAQACSYCYGRSASNQRFLGFAGMEGVKFRGQVLPGDRLVMAAQARSMKSRISSFECQGFVNRKMVFEGMIHGVAL